MKTTTTEELNSFIRKKGGSVSVEEFCGYIRKFDKVIVGTSAIPEEFSIIDYLEKECPEFHSKNVRSLIVGFVQLKEEFGWSFSDIKTNFLKEVKHRTSVPECGGFSLTRCLEGSLNNKEKEILPIYKNSYVAYISFLD